MNNFIKFKFILFKFKYAALIFVISGLFACIIGKEIELILFFISYVFLRYQFPKTYHDSNFYKCIFWSTIMLILSTYIMLPKSVSLISCVPIAFTVDYLLYKIKDYIDLKEIKDRKYAFNINNCTKYELIKRCKEKGFSKSDIEIAIKMFYEKIGSKELSEILSIEIQSAKNKKYIFKKRLK